MNNGQIMLNSKKLAIHFSVMITLSCYLVSCKEAPIKTNYGNFTSLDSMSNEEFKKRQQDPSLMIQEIERDMRSKNLEDIKKQDDKEQAARNKRLNELIDKQLHGQSDNK